MSDVVIRIRNLSKEYHLGVISHGTLYQDLQSGWAKFLGKEDPNAKIGSIDRRQLNSRNDRFCALKDISFDVCQGDIIGIIGRNGAGKSTLLKIISRVTAPTKGTIKIKGRIASLLEVGTGFHSELTGRENIFLNGAILGMQKGEIEQKFDEIVKFSEIDKFIDTPVKRYSSGMYVRLAFAVAANLEPEILLVDEVLAVGDAAFQKKCLGKMGNIAKEGRTILFVSHNMGAVQSLCKRGIWINDGSIFEDGEVSHVINQYLQSSSDTLIGKKEWANFDCPRNNFIKLCSVTLKDSKGNITSQINISEKAVFEIEYEVCENARAQFSLVLFDSNGFCVFGSLSNSLENEYHGKNLRSGRYCSKCYLYGNLLNEGRYYVSLICTSEFWRDDFRADYVLSFDAIDDGILKMDYPGTFGGVIRPKLIWETVYHD
jgi:lipopolysaccharide transport system ATP-binding protein